MKMFHFKNFISLLFLSLLLITLPLRAKEIIEVTIKNNLKEIYFYAEIAKNKIEREKGLMFRKNLKKDQAMLFIFPNQLKISIWMKNTLIPLDIIFISKNKKIVDIINNAKAMTEDIHISRVEAKYALEINSGLAKELKIQIGNDIYFEERN